MKIDRTDALFTQEELKKQPEQVKRADNAWYMSSISRAPPADPYNLDIKTVLKNVTVKEQTGTSVSCPPCNETNNTCYGTQCCSADCSGNPNCS